MAKVRVKGLNTQKQVYVYTKFIGSEI